MAKKKNTDPESKSYVCNRFKSYSIGEDIHFKNGLFTTSDPAQQARIESNDWFGVHIHPQDAAPEAEEAPDGASEDQEI